MTLHIEYTFCGTCLGYQGARCPLTRAEGNMSTSSGGGVQAPALKLLWQAVTCDPMDFQSWTALLSQVLHVSPVVR